MNSIISMPAAPILMDIEIDTPVFSETELGVLLVIVTLLVIIRLF